MDGRSWAGGEGEGCVCEEKIECKPIRSLCKTAARGVGWGAARARCTLTPCRTLASRPKQSTASGPDSTHRCGSGWPRPPRLPPPGAAEAPLAAAAAAGWESAGACWRVRVCGLRDASTLSASVDMNWSKNVIAMPVHGANAWTARGIGGARAFGLHIWTAHAFGLRFMTAHFDCSTEKLELF
eukprot:365533-Chlamydomonas_euryale.AAC.13